MALQTNNGRLNNGQSPAPESGVHALTERGTLLEEQARELTAQTKSMRVLEWTVRSLCDPQSLLLH